MPTALRGAFIALFLTPALAAAEPKSPSAEEIADSVQRVYDKTKTFRARFHQHFQLKAYDKTKDGQGFVVFAKPGKMSWRYSNNANRVVSDGRSVRIYQAEDKTLYEQPIEHNQYPAALAFLVGGGNLRKDFHLKKLSARGFKNGFVLIGTPKKAAPSYRKIALYIDAKTRQVRRVLLLDAQGNRNRFDFSAAVVNVKVAPSEFVFVPPSGTRVVRP